VLKVDIISFLSLFPNIVFPQSCLILSPLSLSSQYHHLSLCPKSLLTTEERLMLGEMNKTIQQRGDLFILLHWDDYKGSQNPKGGYYISSDKINTMMAGLAKEGAYTLNASTFFNFTDSTNIIAQDNHPSIKGNELMAARVEELIRASGLK